MRPITEGDKIVVFWVDGTEMNGTVEHAPVATGDLWYIKDNGGMIHAVNPSASNFEQIIKQEAK